MFFIVVVHINIFTRAFLNNFYYGMKVNDMIFADFRFVKLMVSVLGTTLLAFLIALSPLIEIVPFVY